MREGKIESKHSIKSLEGIGSRSNDERVELRMHSLTVNCFTFLLDENVAVVVPMTSVEVDATGSKAMLLFVGKVFDEKSGKVNGAKNIR